MRILPETPFDAEGGVSKPWDSSGKPSFTPWSRRAQRFPAPGKPPPSFNKRLNARAALSLFAAFALASSACFAQSAESQSGAQIRYHVEFIAFEYQGPDTSAGEALDTLLVTDYLPAPAFDRQAQERLRATVSHTDISILGRALQRLRASPQYSVLTTSAWIQPLLGQSEAVAVPVGQDPRQTGSLSGPPAPRVSGSVRVFGSRLLFVDLALRATLPDDERGTAATTRESGEAAAGAHDRDTFGRALLDDGLVSYRISEKRRIKLEEVHYFDHPRIGALLYVTRYEG